MPGGSGRRPLARGLTLAAIVSIVGPASTCAPYASLSRQDIDLTPLTEVVVDGDLADLHQRFPDWELLASGGAQRTGGPSTDGSLVWLRDERSGISEEGVSWRIVAHVKSYRSTGSAIQSFRWSCENHAVGLPEQAMYYVSEGPTQYCVSPVVQKKSPPLSRRPVAAGEAFGSFASVRRGRLVVLLIETRSGRGTAKNPLLEQIGRALSTPRP